MNRVFNKFYKEVTGKRFDIKKGFIDNDSVLLEKHLLLLDETELWVIMDYMIDELYNRTKRCVTNKGYSSFFARPKIKLVLAKGWRSFDIPWIFQKYYRQNTINK